MSLAALNQVFVETRRLAIAGSHLAVGDFRLKKLVEPLEKSAQKAPVFGAVAKAIDRLVTGNEKDSAQSLLDLCSLVLAILYTQGQTGAEGDLKPVESKQLSLGSTQLSAGLLKPVIQALTSTGSSRLEVIREAHQNGAFADIRLVNPAVAALDDTYAEIADYVTDKILPKFGTAIVPEIQSKIDIKGKAGNVRRLRLLYALDPAGARPLVLEAFENGSKEMKVAALGCLGDSVEDLPHLLEQAGAKSKEVRQAALSRLGKFSDSASIALLTKALIGADRDLAVDSIRQSKNEELWTTVHQITQREFAELFTLKDKAKLDKALERFGQLLACYLARNDKESVAQLAAMHDRRAALKKLKGTPLSGADLCWKLCQTMLFSGDLALLQRLVDDREQMQDESFVITLAAAVLVLPAAQVFDDYSKYFLRPPAKSKPRQGESPRSAVLRLLPDSDNELNWYSHWGYRFFGYASLPPEMVAELKAKKWDPRWLDAAIQVDELPCALRLGDAKHAGLKKYLNQRFEAGLKKKELDHSLSLILQAMIEFNYPEATERLIQLIQKYASSQSHYYSTYYLAPLVSKLPKSSEAAIEKILPELPERLVDDILPHLQTLKAKPS